VRCSVPSGPTWGSTATEFAATPFPDHVIEKSNIHLNQQQFRQDINHDDALTDKHMTDD
jgi:hypothetical protein